MKAKSKSKKGQRPSPVGRAAAGSGRFVTFGELWVGDRFRAGKALWTRLDHQTARRHSEESIALGDNGYGYFGDAVCSFERSDIVEFVALNTQPCGDKSASADG